MEAKIQKWGNSLALRIPKSFAAHVHFEQNTSVDINYWQELLMIISTTKYKLEHP